jgi:hypothetical protein
MGKTPRTCGGSNCYYKLTWSDFFDVFVGKLIEVEHNELEESSVPNVHNVPNTPTHLANLEEQTTNIETVPPLNVDTSQEQSGLDTLSTLGTELPPSNEKTNSSDLTPKQEHQIAEEKTAEVSAEGVSNLQATPQDSAEACLANPICEAKLVRCIWKRLKVPWEERKAALYAEIERRGELFAYCLKDAVERTRRVTGA